MSKDYRIEGEPFKAFARLVAILDTLGPEEREFLLDWLQERYRTRYRLTTPAPVRGGDQ